MKCLKCGLHFGPEEIAMMEDDEEQLCDNCALQGECYIFHCHGKEVVVCGMTFEDILKKWQAYQQRKLKYPDDEFIPENVEIRKIEHVIVGEHLD